MKTYVIDVAGKYACFTRPEFKTDRVSYDVPTPAVVRNIFHSIYWKPMFRWIPRKVEILKPIRWINFTRNEIKDKISPKSKVDHFFIENHHTQRNTTMLYDVRYRLHVDMEYLGDGDARQGDPDSELKHNRRFEERLRMGQCIMQPCLGCSECFCWFGQPNGQPPIDETKNLGFMFYDWIEDVSTPWSKRAKMSRRNTPPEMFDAQMTNGVVEFPMLYPPRGNRIPIKNASRAHS